MVNLEFLLSWEPENLESNSDAKIIFDVTDIFLKNKPVSTNYEFSITQNDRIIFEQNGISTDSKKNIMLQNLCYS